MKSSKKNGVEASLRERKKAFWLILGLGLAICVWDLGNTGLVDETPPLFAAAGRAMSSTGDWLTPRVNGLTRFDKPPLVYWLMGIGYSLPLNDLWDPLGTWAARLPSAFSTVLLMLFIGDTVIAFPQQTDNFSLRTGITAALVFGLSPLVLIWSRIAVSDALLCSTFGLSMLLNWRRYANPGNQSWWPAWFVLGLAVLTKGPVSLVLMGLVLFSFGLYQGQLGLLWKRLSPLRGLLVTLLVSLPWYLIELLVEGKPFFDSFFGYHNLQRFTSVVNNHHEPWWFFLLVLVMASLPFTPLLFLSLFRVFNPFSPRMDFDLNQDPNQSLKSFSAIWLIAILFFFTCSATKLPSYWLPATPAASLLISLSLNESNQELKAFKIAWLGSIFCAFTISIVLLTFPFWTHFISDPEMPTLAFELIESKLVLRAGLFFAFVAISGLIFSYRLKPWRLFAIQFPILFFHLFSILPIFKIGDSVRHLPIRNAAKLMIANQRRGEPLAMIGVVKPSLHFYTNQVIVYEGREARALVNLSDRLWNERRKSWIGRPISGQGGAPTVLILIDRYTIKRSYWSSIKREVIGQYGIYSVWRLNRLDLDKSANKLVRKGISPDWKFPRPERF